MKISIFKLRGITKPNSGPGGMPRRQISNGIFVIHQVSLGLAIAGPRQRRPESQGLKGSKKEPV